MYPPGQFSSWNRASTRAAWLGVEGQGGARGEEAEPGYSALAVSDPSADATVTQTWEAIDDGLLSDRWAPARTDRDWGSHTGETGPVRQRSADGRPAAPAQPAGPGREPRKDARNARTDGRSTRTEARNARTGGRSASAAQPVPFGSAQTAPAAAVRITAIRTAAGRTAAGRTAGSRTAAGRTAAARTGRVDLFGSRR